MRKKYSVNTRFIRLPCVGRLSALDILTSFENGADLILVLGCEEGKCHYLKGNSKTKLLVEITKELLEEIGWDSNRIKMQGLFLADVHKFSNIIEEAVTLSKNLKHSPARLKFKNSFRK